MNTKCEKCKGTGKLTATMQTYGSDKVDTFNIDCHHCDGTGQMTQEQIDYIEWESKQWCKCEEDHGARYVADNVADNCAKHHWVCKKCGLIKQIG